MSLVCFFLWGSVSCCFFFFAAVEVNGMGALHFGAVKMLKYLLFLCMEENVNRKRKGGFHKETKNCL